MNHELVRERTPVQVGRRVQKPCPVPKVFRDLLCRPPRHLYVIFQFCVHEHIPPLYAWICPDIGFVKYAPVFLPKAEKIKPPVYGWFRWRLD